MLLGRTVIEEIYQNERRLTQFSRFSTKQMFPTDRPPWADAKNRAQYKEGVALPVRIPASLPCVCSRERTSCFSPLFKRHSSKLPVFVLTLVGAVDEMSL